MNFSDTICAPATPPGGALALLRLSGENCFPITGQLVKFPTGNKVMNNLPANTTHFCRIMDQDILIDEVILSLFRAPHSYT
ncbi:MAG: tRNA uridine-5-carboxymethylaminomethyl(34) synthesis GTPase MnmE, partial [Bacteroidales bacterium]|nr:tRNA uridine-5-carboxymethylaminomethyl(34) synthesis GTPase MnmE [Bacteroidales bacterium]